MAYTGYAGVGNPSTGSQGVTRSQMDPGYTPGTQTPVYNAPTGGMDPNVMGQNVLSQIYAQWQPSMALSQALGQNQIDLLGNQRDLSYMQGDLQSQQAQQQANYGIQGIGLSREQQAVQQGALSRQMSLLPQQYGLQQQQFGVQGQRLDEQTKEAWQGAQQQQQDLTSSATAGGTWNMPGTSRGMGRIKTGLENALTNIGFGRQDLSINQQQAGLTFKEQQAQQQDSQKMLDIQTKKLGLDESQIRDRLQNSLNQIGIGTQVSVDQLLSEMYKTQQGELSPLSGLFGSIAQASGVTIPSQQ